MHFKIPSLDLNWMLQTLELFFYVIKTELGTASVIFCPVWGWLLKLSQEIEMQHLFTQQYPKKKIRINKKLPD